MRAHRRWGRSRLSSIASWLLVLAIITTAHSQTGRRRRTTVEPEDEEEHESEGFRCDYRSKTIPLSWVNDDVCDCKDGTDEPLTSACSMVKTGRTFKCENKGSRPIWLFPSRLHDGICDCCDGSDEREGVCVNRCREEREELAKEAEEEYKIVLEGRAKRKAAEVQAVHMQEAWAKELAAEKASKQGIEKLLLRIKTLRAKEEGLENSERFSWARGARRRALEEAIEREMRELDKDRPPDSTQHAAGEAAAEKGPGGKEGGAVYDASGDEEEEQESAVRAKEAELGLRSDSKKGKKKEAKADPLADGDDGIARILAVEVTVGNRTRKLRDYIEEEDLFISGKLKPQPPSIDRMRRERTLFAGLMEEGGPTELLVAVLQLAGAIFLSPVKAAAWGVSEWARSLREGLLPSWVHEDDEPEAAVVVGWSLPSLPSSLRPLEWALEHMWDGPNLAYAYFFPASVEGYERLEASLMRKAIEVAEEELLQQQKHIDSLAQRGKEGDWGPQMVFLTWSDTCFDATDASETHSYKVCPFQHVKQGSVLVGRWAGWRGRSPEGVGKAAPASRKSKATEPADYTRMLFDGGQQCYRGPRRSAEVKLVCSPEEAITEVSEPSICVYDMVMTTPLACDDRVLKEAEAKMHGLAAVLEPDKTGSTDEL